MHPIFPEELVDRVFQLVDPEEQDGREALKRCRLVSRQYRRIVHPYAFIVIQVTGTGGSSANPFEKHARFSANPKNAIFTKRVAHLVFAGDGKKNCRDRWDYAIADWSMIWEVMRHLPALMKVTIYRIQLKTWSNPQFANEQVDFTLDLIPKYTPALAAVTMEEVSFAIRSPTLEFPPMLMAKSVEQLLVRNVNFATWGQGILLPRCTIPTLIFHKPDYVAIRYLRKITGITHLELWDVIDDEIPKVLFNNVVEDNRETLKVLVLGFEMNLSGASSYFHDVYCIH